MKGFESFKDRPAPCMGQRVRVHRNLNRKGVWWSLTNADIEIMGDLNRLVLGHVREITLDNAHAVINERGQQRIAAGANREVHAWIEGYVGFDFNPRAIDQLAKIVYYPHKAAAFVIEGTTWPVTEFRTAHFNEKGMHAE